MRLPVLNYVTLSLLLLFIMHISTARNNLKPTTTYSEDDLSQDDDDGLPDTLSGDENPRYMGSHIPSKSFKYLQHSIGQDENEAIQNGNTTAFGVFCIFYIYKYKVICVKL